MLKVAIIGGSGYTGGELLRLLEQHPYVKITAVTSERFKGKQVSELFPNLKNCRLKFEPLKIKNIAKNADLFFVCLPHKTSQGIVASLYKTGKKVIDLSADYRLKSAAIYRKWYETKHMFPALLKKAVYGLPELYRKKIKNASIVANPGCYPTGAILGLAPIMKNAAFDFNSIIVDSKSGVSGAGRNPAPPFMFSEVNESVKAYAVTIHRHTPEIEQQLSFLSKKKITINFTPHLIPVDRGILSTIYVQLKKKTKPVDIKGIYKKYYANEIFVNVLDKEYPNTKTVTGTNSCTIALFANKRKTSLIIVTAIDNLLKGASGQAVQNMNIMYGFNESTALKTASIYP
ncbi:MAG: N-acetyl-gamma-glutamyl-phosphate reductase [Candidatus Mariimomonas ferrooxydans]